MPWIILILAGLFEILWSYFMKQSMGFTKVIPTLLFIISSIISVILLSISMKSIPLGTAYVIWTGIGAIGAFLIGIFILHEPTNYMRLIAACFIIIGLIMMKISSSS